MSFKEAIIIPLEVYKKINLSDLNKLKNKLTEKKEIGSPSSTITPFMEPINDINKLLKSNLPSDIKLKLYEEKNPKNTFKSSALLGETSRETKIRQIKDFVQQVTPRNRPFANSILEVVLNNSNYVDWDPNSFEIFIYRQLIPTSNILDIILYLTKSIPATSAADEPLGTKEFFTALDDLGIPNSWFPLKVARIRRQRTSALRTEQEHPISRSRATRRGLITGSDARQLINIYE